MHQIIVTSGPPSGKNSEPRPLAPPSLPLFDIANSFIFECSLPYPPLRVRIFLYVLSSLLVVALPSALCLASLLASVCLFMIE